MKLSQLFEGKGFEITPITKEDREEVLDICAKTFSHVMDENGTRSYLKIATDWDLSVKGTLDGKIVGCYLLHPSNLPRNTLIRNNLREFVSGKGLHGVALALDESVRGSGYGKQLREYPFKLADKFDYIWGQHMPGLKNIEQWKKFGRIVLDDSDHDGIKTTFMPLKPMKTFDHHSYQQDWYTCGPTTVKMVADFLGVDYKDKDLIELCGCNTTTGTIDTGIASALTNLGIHFQQYKHDKNAGDLSAIEYLNETLDAKNLFIMRTLTRGVKHWILVYKRTGNKYLVADPWLGKIQYSKKEILSIWEPRNFDGFRVFVK